MIEKKPLYEQIERELREEILSGRIAPGERISIDDLASRLGISSTPIRDAVRMLEWKGFVKVHPRRFMHVVKLDARAFKDIYDIRIALECMAVELACQVIPDHEIDQALHKLQEAYRQTRDTSDRSYLAGVDDLVHDLVIRHCGNSRLMDNIDGLKDVIAWARSYVALQPLSYESAYPEHIDILEALSKRDCPLAVQAMRTHLKNSLDRTIQQG